MLTNFVESLKDFSAALKGKAHNWRAKQNQLDDLIDDAERVMTQYVQRVKNLQEALGTNYPTAEEVFGAAIAAIHENKRLQKENERLEKEVKETRYERDAAWYTHRDRSLID